MHTILGMTYMLHNMYCRHAALYILARKGGWEVGRGGGREGEREVGEEGGRDLLCTWNCIHAALHVLQTCCFIHISIRTHAALKIYLYAHMLP